MYEIWQNMIFQQVSLEYINPFLNVSIYLLIYFTFSNVLDLADPFFYQKR